MAKFKFSLEPLKKIRRNKYDIAQCDTLQAQRKLFELEAELSKSQQQQIDHLYNQQKVATKGQDLVSEYSLHELAKKRQEKQRKDILMAGLELERQKRWLAELRKDLKIIEKLEERKKQEFLEEQKKLEQKRTDQWTSQLWARKALAGDAEK